MPSVIHSARPTVSPVAILFSLENCFVLRDFEMWGRTDRQHVRYIVIIMLTTGLDCGSASWIKIADVAPHIINMGKFI